MLSITEYRSKFFHLVTHTFPLRFFNGIPLLLCYAALLFINQIKMRRFTSRRYMWSLWFLHKRSVKHHCALKNENSYLLNIPWSLARFNSYQRSVIMIWRDTLFTFSSAWSTETCRYSLQLMKSLYWNKTVSHSYINQQGMEINLRCFHKLSAIICYWDRFLKQMTTKIFDIVWH